MSSSAKAAKTPEEQDGEELREVEGKMKEVLDLMTARHRRDDTDARLLEARARRDDHTGNRQPVFHVGGGHHAPTTMHTKTELDLAEQLELDNSLERLSARQVAVLERMLTRSPY
jgi:hypothetical protein